jgi:tRNA (guanine9-N1)-methyltransferase
MNETEAPSPTVTSASLPMPSATSNPGGSSSVLDNAAHPLVSKSAMKRAARAERYAASKLQRRAKEKEAKKEKKRIKAEKRAMGELEDDAEENKSRKKRQRIQFGGKVVIDLDFDQLMTEKVGQCCFKHIYRYSNVLSSMVPGDNIPVLSAGLYI